MNENSINFINSKKKIKKVEIDTKYFNIEIKLKKNANKINLNIILLILQYYLKLINKVNININNSNFFKNIFECFKYLNILFNNIYFELFRFFNKNNKKLIETNNNNITNSNVLIKYCDKYDTISKIHQNNFNNFYYNLFTIQNYILNLKKINNNNIHINEPKVLSKKPFKTSRDSAFRNYNSDLMSNKYLNPSMNNFNDSPSTDSILTSSNDSPLSENNDDNTEEESSKRIKSSTLESKNNSIDENKTEFIKDNRANYFYYESISKKKLLNKWAHFTYVSWVKWASDEEILIFLNEVKNYIEYDEINKKFRFKQYEKNYRGIYKYTYSKWYDIFTDQDKSKNYRNLAFIVLEEFKNVLEYYQRDYGSKRFIGLKYFHESHKSIIEEECESTEILKIMCYEIPKYQKNFKKYKNNCRTCGCLPIKLNRTGKCNKDCGIFNSNPLICQCPKGENCPKYLTGECCNQTWHDLTPEQKIECNSDFRIFNSCSR